MALYPRKLLKRCQERIGVDGTEPFDWAQFDFRLKRNGTLCRFLGYRYNDQEAEYIREVLGSIASYFHQET